MWEEITSLVALNGTVLIMIAVVCITLTVNVKLKLVLHCLEEEVATRNLMARKLFARLEIEKIERKLAMARPLPNRMETRKLREKREIKTIPKENARPEKYIHLYEGQLISLIKQLAPFLDDFARHPEQYNVCPKVVPGFLYNTLPSHPPEEPCSLKAVGQDFVNIVLPGYTHWQHPNFVAYFPCGRTNPDTMAELLISVLGVPTMDWSSCPSLSELEVAMANWVGRAFGLPTDMLYHGDTEVSKGGGIMLESASEAIFLAVLSARTAKINQIMRQEGELGEEEHFHWAPLAKKRLEKHHEIAGKLVIYASTEAHSSIEKGCRMGMVELHHLKGDPTKDYAVTEEILEKAIQEDLAAGRIPCMLHVILGSTSSVVYDDLAKIGPIAKRYGMWVHVDSAFAGATWIQPNNRIHQQGIEYVDSIDINLHKILLHSNPCSFLWTRDLGALRAACDDVTDMFLHDSRRHRALKVWFVFRSMGIDGLKEFIDRVTEMANYLRDLMKTHPNVRMFGELKPPGFFSFQYYEPGMEQEEIAEHSERLSRFMNETGRMWITYSKVHNHGIIRISVGYEKVCKLDMDNLWGLMKDCIETYRKRKTDPTLILFPPSAGPKKAPSPAALLTPHKQPSTTSTIQ